MTIASKSVEGVSDKDAISLAMRLVGMIRLDQEVIRMLYRSKNVRSECINATIFSTGWGVIVSSAINSSQILLVSSAIEDKTHYLRSDSLEVRKIGEAINQDDRCCLDDSRKRANLINFI